MFIFEFMNILNASPILERLSALGDGTRTRMLALLDGSEFTVSELCSVLQMPQPTVSRHLKTLANEGWVQARTEGRKRHYHLNPQLEDSTRSLWRIVNNEVRGLPVYRADAERAQPVLDERRMRATAFFSESAAEWDRTRAELFGSATGLGPLLGLIDPTWVVGDLGCGTGALTARIAPFARRTIGIDRSPAMLSTAQARLCDMETAELRCGELESLPIGDQELDLAILALVLHYIVDPREVLSEVHRTLAPGGRVLVLDMRRHDRGASFSENMGHVWPGFEFEQLEAWLTNEEFSSIRFHELTHDPDTSGPLLFLASASA